MKIEEAKVEIESFNNKRWQENYKVEIIIMNEFLSKKDDKLKLCINWSAIGTVSIEETRKFVAQLNEAISWITLINNYNFKYEDWR